MKKFWGVLLTIVFVVPSLALAQLAPCSATGDTTNTTYTCSGKGTGGFNIQTVGAGAIKFFTTATERWDIEAADGDLVPFADGNVDIGSAAKEVDNIYAEDVTISNTLGVTSTLTATAGIVTGGNIVSDTDGNDSVGTAAVNFGDAYFGDGTDYIHLDEDQLTATAAFAVNAGTDLTLSTGANAGDDLILGLDGASSDFFVMQDDGTSVNFQITQAGVWSSKAGLDLGLEYVTGANTACTTTCAVADGGALFGVDLAGGATAPVIVEADDATADACLCLELTS